MASNDKLWFELGVRDYVTNDLKNILSFAEKIQKTMDKTMPPLVTAYENANKLEQAFDKISVSLNKVNSAMKQTKNIDDLSVLKKMRSELLKMQSAFEKLEKKGDKILGSKDTVKLEELKTGLDTAVKQVDRYTRSIEQNAKAEDRAFKEQVNNIDTIKNHLNDLKRIRQELSETIVEASSRGIDTSAAKSTLASVTGKIGSLSNKIKTGGNLPDNYFGADFKEWKRGALEEASNLLGQITAKEKEAAKATKEYNDYLTENQNILFNLKKARLDTESQQVVAGIKKQQSEYDALAKKLVAISELEQKVQQERAGLLNGTVSTPTYTGTKIAEEMSKIQRSYNEDLAANKERERAQMAVTAAVRQNITANNSLIASYDKVAQAGGGVNRVLSQMEHQFGTYVSLYGAERLLKSIIQVGGEFEVQHIALKTILGDVEQANSMFNQMKQLAVVSPFNFKQLADYSKQLAAFNIPYEEMYDTTKRLADMSAGLGVDMSRLILAYGQVRSAAVLRGQELRQFTEAGIPLVKALADEFTRLNGHVVTTGEVFGLISKRAVPFEMVKKVMWDMTNEGGRFFNMQFVLADTLAGKWSNLQDAWQIMLSGFAKGESIGGRMLKQLVQGTTTLIENLDRLAPMIGGIVAAYGGHKMTKVAYNVMGNFTMQNIDDNIAKTQKMYALELKRKYLSGEINAEAYKHGLQLNRNTQHYYMLLAQEGKLKEYQIAKAIQLKKINTENLVARARSGEITVAEAKQLLIWRQKYAQASLFSLKMKEIGLSLKTMMGPLGWISLIVDGLVFALGEMYFNSQRTADALKEASDTYLQSAKDREREISESLESFSNIPQNDEEYRNSIAEMKRQLKQYDANYGGIMREVDSLETLKEQYEKLREELEYVREGYELASKSKADFESVQQETTDLADKATDWSRANNELSRSLTNLAAHGTKDAEDALERMATIIPKLYDVMFDDKGVRKKLGDMLRSFVDVMNFEEISDALAALQGRSIGFNNTLVSQFKSLFGELDKEDRDAIEVFLRNAQERTEIYNSGIEKEILKIKENTISIVATELGTTADELKKKLSEKGNDIDQHTKTLLRNTFNQQMSAISSHNQELMKWVDSQRWTLYFHYDIVADYQEKGKTLQGGALTAWNRIRGGNGESTPKPYGFTEKDLEDAFGATGNDFVNAEKVLNQKVDEAEDVAKKTQASYEKGIATIEQAQEAQREFETKERELLLIAPRTNKNKGGSGGSKTDKKLKEAKEQLAELKSFMSEYEKYEKEYGRTKAIDLVEGFFPQFKGMGDKIVDNYIEELEKIKNKFANTKDPERQKFVNSINQLEAEIHLKFNKKDAEKVLAELNEYISRQTEKWNLYKSLLEKTGSKEIAQAAFADGQMWDDLANEFADELKTKIDEKGFDTGAMLKSVFGRDVDVSTMWNLTDEQAKEMFKNVEGGYDLWKKIVDLIRGNYTKFLNDSADAYSKTVTKSKELLKIESEIEELKSKRDKYAEGSVEYKGYQMQIDNKEKERRKKQVELDDVATDTLQLYSAPLSMTAAKAEEVGKKLRENLVQSLKDGTISADEYIRRIKKIDTQIDKARYGKDFFSAFKSGGIEGAKKLQLDIADDEVIDASQRLEEAENKLREAIEANTNAQTEEEKQKTQEAVDSAQQAVDDAEKNHTAAVNNQKAAKKSYEGAKSFNKTIGMVAYAISAMVQAYNDAKNAAAAYGENLDANMNETGQYIMSFLEGANTALSRMQSGDFAGAISGFVFGSIASIAQKHDTTLKEDQKRSELVQKTFSNMMSLMEKKMESLMGTIDELEITDADRRNLYDYLGVIDPSIIKGLMTGNDLDAKELVSRLFYHYKGDFSDIENPTETQKAAMKAIESGKYFDAAYANMLIQRDELMRQIADEEDMKDADEGKILDMKEELAEMEEDIKNFAKDMAEALYDIDFKSWANDLAEALVSAWAAGEDGAEAYKKKVSEILKNLGVKMITERIIAKTIQPIMDRFLDQYQTDKGVLTEQGLAIIAEMYEAGEEMAQQTNAFMDGINEVAKQYGADLKDTSSSGSTGSSIKGITENTADLLASYLNAVRADVSVIRITDAQYYPQFLSSLQQGNVIADSQLRELQMIAGNTSKNAQLVGQIYDILKMVTPDKTSIRVK